MKLIRTPLQWLVVLLVAMFNTLAVYVSRQPHSLEAEECSRLYQRYADSPDIRATYVKNYRVNDTLTLNATLLEAVTDTGWAILLKDFNFEPYPPEILALITSTNAVQSWYVLHGTSDGPMDTLDKGNNDFVMASQFEHNIMVFDIRSREHMSALFDMNVNNLINQQNNQQ